MKNLIAKYWPFFSILILSILIGWPLFLPGYFSHHDDLQVMRIFEMRKCLEDLQIPCRWVPDMGYGNGYPLFNYYNVFPYYIGAIGSFFFGFIGSAKLLFLIAVALAGLSMYLLVRNLLGIYPALVATTLYMFAPYRALDIYVRGAIAESFSIAIIPLIFYFAFKFVEDNQYKFKIGFALSVAAFLTSHNIMSMLFLPVILILLLIWFWKRKFTVVKSLTFYLLLGFGLSAFFTVPAFLETNLVQIDNLTRTELDFRGHFVTLHQLLLDRSWGYGASFPGASDTLSFQIGWPHYFLVIFSFFVIPFVKIRKRLFILFLSSLFIFIFSIFMTHIRSVFIWERIELLRFVQFPWRFLAVSIFSSSLLGGFLIYYLKKSVVKFSTIILIIIIIILNWGYFKPNQFLFDLTDKEKLSGKLWEVQQKAAILDYLPTSAVEPLEPAPSQPIIVAGDTEIKNFQKKSNSWQFEAVSKRDSQIEVPVFDFPNWQVFVNGKKVKHSNENYLGRISFNLGSGDYLVSGKFENTLFRTISNLVSLISILIIIFIVYGKNRKIVN